MRGIIASAALALLMLLAGCSSDGNPTLEPGEALDDTGGAAASAEDEPMSPIRFYREYVTVEPSAHATRVSALYYFRNESDRAVSQGIRYPFPVDRTHLYPDVVRVWEVAGDELRPMGFVHRPPHALWKMDLEPLGEKLVRVDYVQEIREPRAIYIVTTTREWKRPIELAEFEFRVPAGLGDFSLSFAPDSRTTTGDTIVCYVRYEDFLPDEDLVVTWEER